MKVIRNEKPEEFYRWLVITETGATIKGFIHRYEAMNYMEHVQKFMERSS